MKTTQILNVNIQNISEKELLLQLKEGIVFTPNVDHIVKLQKDSSFYECYKKADWIICDSKILYLCSKLSRNAIQEVIPGSSFFPHFYKFHAKDGDCKIFLLGALDNVAEQARIKINKKIGREIVVGAYSPSLGFEYNKQENEYIHELIKKSGANVVLVGVGAPKQEKWIISNKDFMPEVKIWLALGATIDFEAGKIKRAPILMQKLALEWLFRMFCDPRRLIRRYLCEDSVFFWLFVKQLMGKYHNPWKEY